MTQVSVVIPAYNTTVTLDRTLASVRAQTHANLEIIVVDDGSTDDTVNLASRHAEEDSRIRVASKTNGGVASARNHGIEMAVSDWVAPLDADDVWHPKTVERFLFAAEAAADPVVFVYTWSRRIDAHDRLIMDLGRPRYAGDVLVQLLAANFTKNASATMLNRAATLKVGGYDSGLQAAGAHGAEDIDLYLRLARTGPVAVAEGFHVGYRHMPGSMSQGVDRMRRSIELVLEKLECEKTGLCPDLFSLARTNYDLYAAGLSVTTGNWSNLARYCGKALARKTGLACAYLSVVGVGLTYKLITKPATRQMPVFGDLDPHQTYTLPLSDLIMSLQDRIYRRLFRAPRIRKYDRSV
jgi:hypothetical protein